MSTELSKKGRTLQECFEEAGSVFPFTVRIGCSERDIVGATTTGMWVSSFGGYYRSNLPEWTLVSATKGIEINWNGLSPDAFISDEHVGIDLAFEIKCECGAEASGSSRHSHYCPKFEEAK